MQIDYTHMSGAVRTAVQEPAPISERGWAVFDSLYIQRERRWMIGMLTAYLVAATLFATQTPPWQAPDEPAHYNYIAHIARGDGLPVLRLGDYDQDYRDQIVGARFAPELSIEPLRYESYQPPLYYLSAAPLYWLVHRMAPAHTLTALRLYGVLLGALSLLLLVRCLHVAFPRRALIRLGALGFAGLLPMHVAMIAAVNNDGLAELLLLASMLALFVWQRRRLDVPGADARDRLPAWERRRLLVLGCLLGLGLLTKIYAYIALPLFLLAVAWSTWRTPGLDGRGLRRVRPTLVRIGWVLIPALLLGLPLWLRNARLYGWTDLLALRWHDRVVTGQPTPAEWIAQHGWMAYWERAVQFTFRSFWGVFGWMGVFLDQRIYTALLILSGVLFMGLLWAAVRLITHSSGLSTGGLEPFQRWALGFLALLLLAVFGAYVLYNFEFVQHQGRYLFWGLLAISTFMAIGWRELMQPPQALATGLMMGVLALALGVIRLLGIEVGSWTLLSLGAATAVLLLQPLLLLDAHPATMEWLARRLSRFRLWTAMTPPLRTLCWAAPFLFLFALNLVSLFGYVVPQLRLP